MPGKKSDELLAVFKKADKLAGDPYARLGRVWEKLREQPCSWGNAWRQYKASCEAAQAAADASAAAAQPTPAAKAPASKPTAAKSSEA